MKKKFRLLSLLMALLLAVAFLPGCGGGGGGDDEMPQELQAIADKAISLATRYASQMDGHFGDLHLSLVDSDGEDDEIFEEIWDFLSGILASSDAEYVYLLYPRGSVIIEPYMMTVDASDPDEADEYGVEYEWEPGFTAAWEGEPSAADYIWPDESDPSLILISAYAPFYDSAGEIAGLVGVDYPVADGAAKFPDWVWDE